MGPIVLTWKQASICHMAIYLKSRGTTLYARWPCLGANLLELRQGEVRRSLLSRTPVDNEGVGSLIQNTMTSEVRFLRKVFRVRRRALAVGESLASADGAFALLRIRSYVSSKVQTAPASLSALGSPKGAPHDWK
jgi:hypothetical protein